MMESVGLTRARRLRRHHLPRDLRLAAGLPRHPPAGADGQAMGLSAVSPEQLIGVAIFLVCVYVVVPWAIAASRPLGLLLHLDLGGAALDRQRRRLADLLHRPHQHRAGRLCPGRRLCLGDPRHRLRRLVLVDACCSPASSAPACQRADRPADPAPARRLLRHGHPGPDRGRPAARRWRCRSPTAPAASPRSRCRARSRLRPDAGARLRHPRQRQALLLLRRRHADGRWPSPRSTGW